MLHGVIHPVSLPLALLLLALKSQCKGSNAISIRSLIVDEERMRPSHWLGLMEEKDPGGTA